MPTPDLSAYSDLILYDVQPADLVQRALLDATVKLPDWDPKDGNTEVVLMEALSLVAAEFLYGVNRVPSATTMTVMALLGITRSDGAPATATATFTLSDTLGHDIPAGTIVRLNVGPDAVDFTTTVALSVAAGSSTGTVAVQSSTNTAAVNGVAVGTVLELITAVPFVDTVVLATAVAAGADPESDEDWRTRAIQRFARLNDTLVRPEHFTAETLGSYPQVVRATTIDNYDGAGVNAGHVSVAVLGSNSSLISAGDKTAITAALDAKAQANLAVHVIDPTITNVDVDVTVKGLPGYTAPAIHASVTAALTAYLSPDSWPWAGTVRRYELIALVSDVEGVDYVTTLTTPAADQALSGAAPLAKAHTLTVTVT